MVDFRKSAMKDDPSAHRRKRAASIAQAYRDSQEVMSICLSLGVFVGGGYWLDVNYGWMPFYTVFGVLIGFVAAGFSLRQLLERLERRAGNSDSSHSGKRNSHDQPES